MSHYRFERDIKKYLNRKLTAVPCPLCGTDKHDFVVARKGFPGVPLQNVICRNCGLIRINPRMSDQEYTDFYTRDFFEYLNPFARPAYVEEIEHTTNNAYQTPVKKRLLPFLLDYVKPGARVLDVGAGFGQILYLLKKEKNIEAIGLEPNPHSRKIAREKIGIDLIDENVESFLERNKEIFDFIILDQTFEHLLYPLETLKGLSRILATEGLIFIGVPGTMNPMIPMDLFFQVAHTFNYTPHTLNQFAKRAGLKIVKMREPRGYPLEVLISRSESNRKEAPPADLLPGSDWREVVRILRRKRRLNIVRGAAKKALRLLVGERATRWLRDRIDRLIHYRY